MEDMYHDLSLKPMKDLYQSKKDAILTNINTLNKSLGNNQRGTSQLRVSKEKEKEDKSKETKVED